MSNAWYRVIVLGALAVLITVGIVYKASRSRDMANTGQTPIPGQGGGEPNVAGNKKLPTVLYFGRFV